MLIKRIEEATLTFDDEKEALKNYEKIQSMIGCIESKAYKDFSEEFKKWVYKITYKRIIY